MIIRTWSCSVAPDQLAPDQLAAVVDHIENTGLAECREIEGYLGGCLLQHQDSENKAGLPVLTLVTCWQSWDSIERFAGPAVHHAVLYEEDQAFGLRSDATVDHYQLLRRDVVPPQHTNDESTGEHV